MKGRSTEGGAMSGGEERGGTGRKWEDGEIGRGRRGRGKEEEEEEMAPQKIKNGGHHGELSLLSPGCLALVSSSFFSNCWLLITSLHLVGLSRLISCLLCPSAFLASISPSPRLPLLFKIKRHFFFPLPAVSHIGHMAQPSACVKKIMAP